MTLKKIAKKTEVILVFLPFLIPAYFRENNTIESIASIWCVASALWTMMRFAGKRNRTINYRVLVLFLFAFSMIISTLRNGSGSIYLCLVHIALFILPAFILDTYLKKDYYGILYTIESILAAEIILNFVIQMVFRKGLPSNAHSHYVYLLGVDNRFIFTYLTFLAFGIPLIRLKNRRFTQLYYGILIICNISLIRAWSVGAMIGIFIFDVFFVITIVMKKSAPINPVISTVIWVTAFFLLVVFQIERAFISNIVVDVLRKTITFSGRTLIWDTTKEYISQSPWLGHGIQTSATLSAQFALGASHPHCQVLYFLYHEGIFGLLLQAVFVFLCLKKLSSIRDKAVYRMFSTVYLVLMIILLVDSWTSTSYYYMIFMMMTNPAQKEAPEQTSDQVEIAVSENRRRKNRRKIVLRLH